MGWKLLSCKGTLAGKEGLFYDPENAVLISPNPPPFSSVLSRGFYHETYVDIQMISLRGC